jgi:hypothetical protein
MARRSCRNSTLPVPGTQWREVGLEAGNPRSPHAEILPGPRRKTRSWICRPSQVQRAYVLDCRPPGCHLVARRSVGIEPACLVGQGVGTLPNRLSGRRPRRNAISGVSCPVSKNLFAPSARGTPPVWTLPKMGDGPGTSVGGGKDHCRVVAQSAELAILSDGLRRYRRCGRVRL